MTYDRRYLRRHPGNTNLRLQHAEVFEGLPLMEGKGPYIREYLFDLKETIEQALDDYPRLLAFRVDLRLPRSVDLPVYTHTNEVISRFFESFTKKIQYHQLRVAERGYSRGCKVRYVWAREVGNSGRQHYHLLILLNRDAYYTIGKLGSERSNMIKRIEGSWASALGIPTAEVTGLLHIPRNAMYRVDRDTMQDIEGLFYRASYLCKAATKSYGDQQRGFGSSRG